MKVNIFSKEEEHYYHMFQKLRDDLFLPICKQLDTWGVKPEHLSYLGALCVVPFVYFFPSNPWFSAFFVCLNMFFDSLDGPLARYSHSASDRGAVIDLICDYGSFVVIFLTIAFYGLMITFWAGLYIIQYGLMLYFVTYCRSHNVKFFPIIRSKYYVYLVMLWLLITGLNWFGPFLVLFSVYMTATNIFLFDRIRCSKKS